MKYVLWLGLYLSAQRMLGQGYGAVVITEIMANPNPPAGLPNAEYLEIFNRTEVPVRLKSWTLTVGARSTRLPDSLLLPGAYALLMHQSDVALISPGKKVIGLSSLSLPNDGAQVSLFNSANTTVFSVRYSTLHWPPGKSSGHSLEMIDVDRFCVQEGNWMLTSDPAGGTPGEPNRVAGIIDSEPLSISHVAVTGSNQVQVVFNQSIDSLQTSAKGNIKVAGEQLAGWHLERPDFSVLSLTLGRALQPDRTYELSLEHLQTCAGAGDPLVIAFGMPETMDSSDIVINEVLFNPPEGGVDYVELYNRSAKYLNLKNTTLSGASGAAGVITTADYLLGPDRYVVLTTDVSAVKRLYPYASFRNFIALSSMPSFSNASGVVRFSARIGRTIDSFAYTEAMHDALVSNPKGVSLERIDPNVSAGDPQNWQSASGVGNFGTPGYANSQSQQAKGTEALHISPDVIVYGNLVTEASATIGFSTRLAGSMGSLTIYDVRGNKIRKLLDNTLLGTAASVSWDGRRDSGSYVPTGLYLVILEYYDRTGKRHVCRGEVAVAGRE